MAEGHSSEQAGLLLGALGETFGFYRGAFRTIGQGADDAPYVVFPRRYD